jgi:ubiquinone/menaquinone biosynthesis C-methylase UbiE
MMISDPTKRFSNRVDNYVKYRPGYPAEVISYIKNEFKLPANPVVADVGAGTGIFSKLLLGAGFTVYAVEPNGPMLIAAIEQLSGNKKFIPTIGTADATTLPDKSVDCIVCAQAFHWFNNDLTRDEFKRILKDGGQVALIWNNRLTDAGEFLKAYDQLLKNSSIDYNKVNHQNIGDIDFKAFFKGGQYQLKKFPNEQVFDEEGLTGRAFSSSYVPPEDTEDGKKFLELLKDVFNRYNVNGKVSFKYQTEVYSGSV